MITIGKPYITKNNGKAYLNAHVEISADTVRRFAEKTKEFPSCEWLTDCDYPPKAWENGGDVLFFETDERYADDLCTERSNAFVTAMFWYACVTGSDISFEVPMSERLYRGLTEMLLPKLLPDEKDRIRITGPVTKEALPCKGGVVTGMSAGVDSFYTLHCYERPDAPGGKRLTHLTHCEAGYLIPRSKRPADPAAIFREERRLTVNVRKRAETIASHHGMSFVPVLTNLEENYYRGGYVFMAMYRYFACMLSLEGLFSTYISSSSGHSTGLIEVSLHVPTQNYEELMIEALQTEGFHYMTSDHALRPEKIKAIADDPDFQKYAEVCFNSGKQSKNCGKCYGCWKTMIPLDQIGKLDLFSESFDLREYYADRKKVFRDLIEFSRMPEADSARETVAQILELAKAQPNETGKEFMEVYDSMQI